MGQIPGDISIHAKKYFKVILEGINTDVASPDSFALELTTRMRLSLPRVKALIGRLPCTVKSHITAAQANRLKDLLEGVGGRVRIESHIVTPEGTGPVVERPSGRTKPAQEQEGPVSCPDCGWESEHGATFCPFCLRKFRDPALRRETLEDRVPEKNPLDADWDPSAARTRRFRARHGYLLLVLLGALAVAATLLLTK